MPKGSESRGGFTSAPICGAKWKVSDDADPGGGAGEFMAGASVGSVVGEGGASGPAGETSNAGFECWNS